MFALSDLGSELAGKLQISLRAFVQHDPGEHSCLANACEIP